MNERIARQRQCAQPKAGHPINAEVRKPEMHAARVALKEGWDDARLLQQRLKGLWRALLADRLEELDANAAPRLIRLSV